MKKAILVSVFLLALACLSPAPIRDISAKGHELPAHSQTQMSSEQRFNGAQGVVGEVTEKKRGDETTMQAAPSDAGASKVVALASGLQEQQNAAKVLAEAEKKIQEQKTGGSKMWLIGALVFGLGFAIFQVLRLVLDRVAPPPQASPSAVRRALVPDPDENW